MPSSIRKQYKWIEGLSVTEMEILHGAYRADNPNGNMGSQLMFCFISTTAFSAISIKRRVTLFFIEIVKMSDLGEDVK